MFVRFAKRCWYLRFRPLALSIRQSLPTLDMRQTMKQK